MFVALPCRLFAEAASACATATQRVGFQACRMPAFPKMLRPLRAGRWKRLLPHARAVGAEPRHTLQGCRHPCVSAASRLAQPFCTRPPDFWERTHWASYYSLFFQLGPFTSPAISRRRYDGFRRRRPWSDPPAEPLWRSRLFRCYRCSARFVVNRTASSSLRFLMSLRLPHCSITYGNVWHSSLSCQVS
jgi:hypothetical protein